MSFSKEIDAANMLLEISNQLARQEDLEIFMGVVASTIMQHTPVNFISITLHDAGQGKIYQVVNQAEGQDNAERFRSFVSRDLVLRRVRYGRLEISFRDSKGIQHRDFLATVDSIADQIALYAEAHSIRQQSVRLQGEVRTLAEAVKRSKAVARATNLLETVRNIGNRAVSSARPTRRLHPGLPVYKYGNSRYAARQ